MPAAPDPQHPATDSAPAVAVTVVRTGGFAGIPRRWRVEADAGDARFWIELIERCPWDRCSAEPPAPDGADRFTWEVWAARGDERRRAELVEQQVAGPWRELIDAVRDADRPAPSPSPSPRPSPPPGTPPASAPSAPPGEK